MCLKDKFALCIYHLRFLHFLLLCLHDVCILCYMNAWYRWMWHTAGVTCRVSLVRVVLEMICFFTEIWILSKYSEDISARAQRINTSQLQCKKLCWYPFFSFLNFEFISVWRGWVGGSALYFLRKKRFFFLHTVLSHPALMYSPFALAFPSLPLSVCFLPRSLHTHAFALVDNLFRQKLSWGEVSF